MNNLDFGDVPSWISGITTLFALVAAFIAALQTRRLLIIENNREARIELRANQEQASKVSSWIGTEQNKEFDLGGMGYKSIGLYLNVTNSSNQAIYDVSLTLSKGESVIWQEKVSVVAPNFTSSFRVPHETIKDFMPSDLANALGTLPKRADEESNKLRRLFELESSFIDSNGRCWNRNSKGILKEVI